MSLVKFVEFLFIFLYLLPFMTALCCMFPVCRHICFLCMLYFTSNEISLNFVPMPSWRGTARGYAFTAVSLFAVPLLASMVFSPKHKVRWFPPGALFYFLYFISVVLSGINAIHMHQWGFEVYKMFWMYITFLAAFNYLNNCKNLVLFVYAVALTLIILFLVGFYQKYRMGIFQIRSTFPHQNSLSLYLELFGLLLLGVLMNERMSKLLFFLVMCTFGGSVLLIIFTYSRGGLVIYFGGIAIVCALSILFNGFSVRRLILMAIGLAVMLSVVGYALPRIILRFTKAPEASKNTRIYLAIAARRMADDFTFGIGANNFSEYSSARWSYAKENNEAHYDDGPVVETIYLLVAAECGWGGLVILLLWFFYYYLSDTISIFVLRKKPCSGIVIGLFGGLTCNYWHSTLEWSLKQFNNFAGQMILYALIGVIAVNRKNIKLAYQHTLELEEALGKKGRRHRSKMRRGIRDYSLPAPAPAEPSLPETGSQMMVPASDSAAETPIPEDNPLQFDEQGVQSPVIESPEIPDPEPATEPFSDPASESASEPV